MNKHKELILSIMLRQSEEAFSQALKMVRNGNIVERDGNIVESDILGGYMKRYISCREAIDWHRHLPD